MSAAPDGDGSTGAGPRPRTPRATRHPAYHWLAALPAIGLLGGVPFANRVHPYVLGLPFLLFWIVAWVVATSALVGVVYALDRARGAFGPSGDDAASEGAP